MNSTKCDERPSDLVWTSYDSKMQKTSFIKSSIPTIRKQRKILLKDLCPEEKKKLANLITTISKLTKENEELRNQLTSERTSNNEKLLKMKEEISNLINESGTCKAKLNESLKMVEQYKYKFEQLAKKFKMERKLYKSKVSELENQIKELKTNLENIKSENIKNMYLKKSSQTVAVQTEQEESYKSEATSTSLTDIRLDKLLLEEPKKVLFEITPQQNLEGTDSKSSGLYFGPVEQKYLDLSCVYSSESEIVENKENYEPNKQNTEISLLDLVFDMEQEQESILKQSNEIG